VFLTSVVLIKPKLLEAELCGVVGGGGACCAWLCESWYSSLRECGVGEECASGCHGVFQIWGGGARGRRREGDFIIDRGSLLVKRP